MFPQNSVFDDSDESDLIQYQNLFSDFNKHVIDTK